MSSKIIGIIIQNQDGNILFHDNSYYYEATVNENEDINRVIAKTLRDAIDKSIHRIIKVYKYPLHSNNKEITMYLVEVGVYNNNFVFISPEKILDYLSYSPDKVFFEKYIVRYEENKSLIYSSIAISLLILFLIDIPFKLNLNLPENFLWIEISLIIISFCILVKYIIPRIAKYLLKFNFNTRKILQILDILLFILASINIIKIIIN
ncbi:MULTISPECIES: hypothetical protein [unclassified Romboutsia]|uniref:hypothetical protein n=1 Tax=unclassified Romboutsia TaxID=2626894 RepID=UPI00082159C6|nr:MULTISPECIES: hypothetical protein [unclassified Romboutsia]SCH42543.1 Uncharacterised protein [uncultured Clostridium sp.]